MTVVRSVILEYRENSSQVVAQIAFPILIGLHLFSAKVLSWLEWVADALHSSRDAAEDRNVGGGLIVLKYTFGGFVGHSAKLVAEQGQARDPEDAGVCPAENIFREARDRGRGLGRADMIGRSVM